MGFMDKARAAASDLAAKADTALANSGIGGPGGDANKYFHDLGVLAYLTETGRPASPEEHERVMGALREMDARGAIHSFALQTSPPVGAVPPPPPGGVAPPPPGGVAPPPPDPAAQTEAPAQVENPATAPPPPPPPSWAKDDTQA